MGMGGQQMGMGGQQMGMGMPQQQQMGAFCSYCKQPIVQNQGFLKVSFSSLFYFWSLVVCSLRLSVCPFVYVRSFVCFACLCSFVYDCLLACLFCNHLLLNFKRTFSPPLRLLLLLLFLFLSFSYCSSLSHSSVPFLSLSFSLILNRSLACSGIQTICVATHVKRISPHPKEKCAKVKMGVLTIQKRNNNNKYIIII